MINIDVTSRKGCIKIRRYLAILTVLVNVPLLRRDNFYKGKHSIGVGLQFQRFSLLSSWQEARRHINRYGAGIARLAGSKRRDRDRD